MDSEEFEKMIVNRTKFLSFSNACLSRDCIRPYALQAIKEFLSAEAAQEIYRVYDITLYDYIDYIIKKVLEE